MYASRAGGNPRGDTSGDAFKRALDHDAFSRNMTWLGVWRCGEMQFYDPEDAKRVGFVRRKEL